MALAVDPERVPISTFVVGVCFAHFGGQCFA
ncbi:hypothetical protein QIJ30_gp4, partial [ssRNA phage SRR5467091_8]